MGLWDHLYNATPKFLTGKPTVIPSDHNNSNTKQHHSPESETQIIVTPTPYPYNLTALLKLTATATTAGAKSLISYLPERDRREKIHGGSTTRPTVDLSDHNDHNTKQHHSPGSETQITVSPTPYPYNLTALLKLTATVTTAGAKNLTYYLPERDRRDKIAGVVTDLGKQTITHAWQIPYNLSLAAALKVNQAFQNESVQNLKHYLPEPDRREKITRIVTNIGKFAVDSAINESLKGFTGGVQVYRIVKEGLKEESSSLSDNGKAKAKAKALKLKEMKATVKKMEEEINTIKAKLEQQQQKHSSSPKPDDGSAEQGAT